MAFRQHIAEKYANTPQEKHRNDRLCDQVDEKFGDLPVEQFGPLKLKEFRADRIAEGLARKYVNRLTNCVIGIFNHAVSCGSNWCHRSIASGMGGMATMRGLRNRERGERF